MQNSQNKKLLQIGLFVLVAVLTLGIGYASINAINLLINGNATASVNQENFVVHFVAADNITGSTGVSGTATYEGVNAEFDVTGLTKVGDYAIAKYIVRNDSAAIGTEITLNLTNSNSEYFKVTETIDDNKLQAGEETYATVRVEMIKTSITSDVTTTVTAKLIANPIENTSATGGDNASKVIPTPFASDSWSTIKTNVQNGNTSQYDVGDTKTVTVNGVDYMVRIANMSSHDWCNEESYSQTACGFVVEFVDIINKQQMNAATAEYPYGKNVGGYPETIVYNYLKNTLYYQLSNELQNSIIDTRVISGYSVGNGIDENCFTTVDKIYLLSGVEVVGYDGLDRSANKTTQLDYYTNSSNSIIKQYMGIDTTWWLRTARSNGYHGFRDINNIGNFDDAASHGNAGVSPAFRIG